MNRTRPAALLFALLSMAGPACAGDPGVSTETIVEALSGPAAGDRPLTRSLAAPQRGAMRLDRHQIDRLRGHDVAGADSLTADMVAASAHLLSQLRLTAIDLPVEFEFGSATPSEAGYRQLNALGAALTSDRLAKASFVLAGHTDAVGGEAANRRLSKHRADAVRAYLVKAYRIQPPRLVALGFGEAFPKRADDPAAAANRRVEVQAYIPE